MERFGPFRLDAKNECVWRGAEHIGLSNTAFRMLSFLASRSGQLVRHEELLDAVWPETHVQPEILKVYVAEIRRALGDSTRDPQYIRTVHRRGYTFLGDHVSRLQPIQRVGNKSFVLVGRTSEFTALHDELEQASAGALHFAFLSGRTGIGKTALIDAFVRSIYKRPDVWITVARCARARWNSEPFSPIIDGLATLLHSDRGQPLIDVIRKSAPSWLIQFTDLLQPEEQARLSADLAGATTRRLIRELVQALEIFCADNLMVLVIDDLDRADPSTLALFEYLSRARPSLRLLILCSYSAKNGETARLVRLTAAELHSRGLAEAHRLAKLSRGDVEKYIDLTAPGGGLASELAPWLYRVAGGIPLFFTQIMEYLRAEGAIINTRGAWRLALPAPDALPNVPGTLRDFIELRISNLTREEQRILEAGSLSGLEFSADTIAAALEVPRAAAEESCNRLTREGDWLAAAGFAGGNDGVTAHFQFLHEIYRNVFYERQTSAERVVRHLRIAVELEKAVTAGSTAVASQLALHFADANEHLRSIKYLRTAARAAAERCMPVESAALLNRGLGIAAKLPRPERHTAELEILGDLGDAYLVLGDFQRSAQAWNSIISRTFTDAPVDLVVKALSSLTLPFGWHDRNRLLTAADRVIQLSCTVEDAAARGEALALGLVARHMASGWSREDSERCRDSVQDVIRYGSPVAAASASISGTWFQLSESRYREAISILEESLPVVAAAGKTADVLRGQWSLVWGLLHAGDWGRAQALASTAIKTSERNGNTAVTTVFTTLLAWLHIECGAWDTAAALCQRTQEATDAGVHLGSEVGYNAIAFAELGRGNAGAALEQFARNLHLTRKSKKFWRIVSEVGVAEALLAAGEINEGIHRAKVLAEDSADLQENTWRALALRTCARLAAAAGDWRQAMMHIKAALAIVQSKDIPLAAWRVHVTAADIHEHLGQSDEAIEYKRAGADVVRYLIQSLSKDDLLRTSFAERSDVAHLLTDATPSVPFNEYSTSA